MRRRPWPILLSVATIVVAAMLALQTYLLDGIDGWFFSRGFEEETEYAAGYSHEAFRQLRLGMAPGDVIALLGPPLERGSLGAAMETWRWSRSPGDKGYRVRAVIFDRDRVIDIFSELHVD